ncbi:unnamed protein product [Victoria cruziana]
MMQQDLRQHPIIWPSSLTGSARKAHCKNGDLKRVLKVLDSMVDRLGVQRNLYHRWINALFNSGRIDKAEELFDDMKKK